MKKKWVYCFWIFNFYFLVNISDIHARVSDMLLQKVTPDFPANPGSSLGIYEIGKFKGSMFLLDIPKGEAKTLVGNDIELISEDSIETHPIIIMMGEQSEVKPVSEKNLVIPLYVPNYMAFAVVVPNVRPKKQNHKDTLKKELERFICSGGHLPPQVIDGIRTGINAEKYFTIPMLTMSNPFIAEIASRSANVKIGVIGQRPMVIPNGDTKVEVKGGSIVELITSYFPPKSQLLLAIAPFSQKLRSNEDTIDQINSYLHLPMIGVDRSGNMNTTIYDWGLERARSLGNLVLAHSRIMIFPMTPLSGIISTSHKKWIDVEGLNLTAPTLWAHSFPNKTVVAGFYGGYIKTPKICDTNLPGHPGLNVFEGKIGDDESK